MLTRLGSRRMTMLFGARAKSAGTGLKMGCVNIVGVCFSSSDTGQFPVDAICSQYTRKTAHRTSAPRPSTQPGPDRGRRALVGGHRGPGSVMDAVALSPQRTYFLQQVRELTRAARVEGTTVLQAEWRGGSQYRTSALYTCHAGLQTSACDRLWKGEGEERRLADQIPGLANCLKSGLQIAGGGRAWVTAQLAWTSDHHPSALSGLSTNLRGSNQARGGARAIQRAKQHSGDGGALGKNECPVSRWGRKRRGCEAEPVKSSRAGKARSPCPRQQIRGGN